MEKEFSDNYDPEQYEDDPQIYGRAERGKICPAALFYPYGHYNHPDLCVKPEDGRGSEAFIWFSGLVYSIRNTLADRICDHAPAY